MNHTGLATVTYLNGSQQQVSDGQALTFFPRSYVSITGQHFLRRRQWFCFGKAKNLQQHGLLGAWDFEQLEPSGRWKYHITSRKHRSS